VASVKNFDLSSLTITPEGAPPISPGALPFRIAGVDALLIAVDRDVILARTDTVVDPLPVTLPGLVCRASQQGCNYQVVLPVAVELPEGVLQVNFERGFVAVDAMVEGTEYRFVNTHLEVREPQPGNVASRVFQTAQAAQLIGALAFFTPPGLIQIVVGDINSAPEDQPVPGPLPLPPPFEAGLVPPYLQFVDAGYTDTWTLRPVARPGFTCCQDPDLRNPRSTLDERIDMIFASDTPTAVSQARVVGARIADKTRPPGPRLWPSDHGGVVATLDFD
jgi:endonuclease/exonuclease/phosphatase family metal-dependent hydrolase